MADTRKNSSALIRRIAPSVPLELSIPDASGKTITKSFRLCFDMNAAAAIEERTQTKDSPGLHLTDVTIWTHAGPRLLRVLLWAAVLAHHPEYNTDGPEGLEVIGSYMDDINSDTVFEAVWKAYLAWLPAAKREIVAKLHPEPESSADPTLPPEKPIPAVTVQKSPRRGGVGSTAGPSPATI